MLQMIIGESYTYSVDWWSFGVTLFLMLTGQVFSNNVATTQSYKTCLQCQVNENDNDIELGSLDSQHLYTIIRPTEGHKCL